MRKKIGGFELWLLFRCTCLRSCRESSSCGGGASGSIPACLTVRSMLACSISSTGIILLTKGSEVEARAVMASVEVFSPLDILVNSNDSNCWVKVLTSSRYASMRSSLALYFPWNWLVTSWELLWACISRIPIP